MLVGVVIGRGVRGNCNCGRGADCGHDVEMRPVRRLMTVQAAVRGDATFSLLVRCKLMHVIDGELGRHGRSTSMRRERERERATADRCRKDEDTDDEKKKKEKEEKEKHDSEKTKREKGK